MFADALKYPFNSEDKLREYGIGVLLIIGSIFIIPAFMLLGYLVRVMSDTLEGEEQLTKFEDFAELLVDGLKLTGIIIAYVLVLIIAIAVISAVGAGIGMEAVFTLIGFLVALSLSYVIPSAMVNFARTGKALSAFDLKTVFEKALTLKYLIGLLSVVAAMIIISVAQLLIGIALIITLVGIPALLVVMPAMNFYEQVVYFRLIARAAE